MFHTQTKSNLQPNTNYSANNGQIFMHTSTNEGSHVVGCFTKQSETMKFFVLWLHVEGLITVVFANVKHIGI